MLLSKEPTSASFRNTVVVDIRRRVSDWLGLQVIHVPVQEHSIILIFFAQACLSVCLSVLSALSVLTLTKLSFISCLYFYTYKVPASVVDKTDLKMGSIKVPVNNDRY